jgi:putative transcriptional regulator
MSRHSEEPSLFQRLQDGLQEGIRFAKGDLNLRTVEIPEPPPVFDAVAIRQLRKKLNVSQGLFAKILNVSTKTLQGWEQGERRPSQASLRLLQIVADYPQIVESMLGLRNGKTKRVK